MLFSANVSDITEIKRKIKIYYIVKNHGNDEVIPDQSDIDHYKNGIITWDGFKLNYSEKLMRAEAMEWMQRVSFEAVSEDVVLVDEENDVEYSYRKLLAELIKNMFTGHLNFDYMGEIIK
jgi:hypothetical protein